MEKGYALHDRSVITHVWYSMQDMVSEVGLTILVCKDVSSETNYVGL